MLHNNTVLSIFLHMTKSSAVLGRNGFSEGVPFLGTEIGVASLKKKMMKKVFIFLRYTNENVFFFLFIIINVFV